MKIRVGPPSVQREVVMHLRLFGKGQKDKDKFCTLAVELHVPWQLDVTAPSVEESCAIWLKHPEKAKWTSSWDCFVKRLNFNFSKAAQSVVKFNGLANLQHFTSREVKDLIWLSPVFFGADVWQLVTKIHSFCRRNLLTTHQIYLADRLSTADLG